VPRTVVVFLICCWPSDAEPVAHLFVEPFLPHACYILTPGALGPQILAGTERVEI